MTKYCIELKVDDEYEMVLSGETDDFNIAFMSYCDLTGNSNDQREVKMYKDMKLMNDDDIYSEFVKHKKKD